MLIRLLTPVALLSAVAAFAQPPSPKPDWSAWTFLTGEWIGEGGGQPGQAASGGFSFEFQLDRRLLVRRSFAEYAATKERPAFRHEDLMYIYQEPVSARKRATYVDNEGHVIDYFIEESDAGRVLSFVSMPTPSAPRFRFVYRKISDTRLSFSFDIAPPGKPDAFSTYLEGSARRKEK